MAEYRYALRTLTGEGDAPSNVLARVHDTIRPYPGMHLSSCVYGQVDVIDGTWTYCSAGHLPTLLVRAGQVTVLPSPHGPPLGAVPACWRVPAQCGRDDRPDHTMLTFTVAPDISVRSSVPFSILQSWLPQTRDSPL